MPQIVFYTESPTTGGHEKMAIIAHQAMIEQVVGVKIAWLINVRNERLATELASAGLPYAVVNYDHPLDVRRPSFRALRQIISVARHFTKLAPDLVVILQGGIVASYGGVLAARLSGVQFCSYIPMAQRSTELAAYRFPRIWDAMRSIYFRLICNYITIDDTQAANIRRENRRATIYTVENYIPVQNVVDIAKKDARVHLDLAGDANVIAVVGRIEFGQKAQDWLVSGLGSDPFLLDKFLLFVGDGPDSSRLQEMINHAQYRDRMRIMSWQADMDTIYAATDLLLVPSRSEGVPLVMLEALSRGIPVAGTDRDGMATWLPHEWRFPFGDIESMKKSIAAAWNDRSLNWRQIEEHLRQTMDRERFGRAFWQALVGILSA
jgi:glycosyltransferase involved in cell wall biosynthesis